MVVHQLQDARDAVKAVDDAASTAGSHGQVFVAPRDVDEFLDRLHLSTTMLADLKRCERVVCAWPFDPPLVEFRLPSQPLPHLACSLLGVAVWLLFFGSRVGRLGEQAKSLEAQASTAVASTSQ